MGGIFPGFFEGDPVTAVVEGCDTDFEDCSAVVTVSDADWANCKSETDLANRSAYWGG